MPYKTKVFKAGEVIIRENTPGNCAYIVESGEVEVSKDIGNQRVVFSEIGKGSVFGEMCLLLKDTMRSATVTAVTDTSVKIWSKPEFDKILRSLSPSVQTLFEMIEERLRETAVLVNPLKLVNFYYSLCGLIYYLAKAEGKQLDGGLHLNYDFVLEECSTILALEKEMVDKVLNRLVFTKLVHLGKRGRDMPGKNFVVSDLNQLKNFVEFLRTHSQKDLLTEGEREMILPDKSYELLEKLLDGIEEFQQHTGKLTISFDKMLEIAEDLQEPSNKDNEELFRPLYSLGLFQLVHDQTSHEKSFICSDTQRLKNEFQKQTELRVNRKMVKLLISLAKK